MRTWVAFAIAAMIGGCSGQGPVVEPETPSLARVRPRPPPVGPRAVETLELDYASIPLLTWGHPREGDLVIFDRSRAPGKDTTLATAAFEGSVRYGDQSTFHTPLPEKWISDSSFGCCAGTRGCGGTSALAWEGFEPRSRTSDHLDYLRAVGALDATTCRPHAEQVGRVRASALLASTLYAFRICVEACDASLGASGRVERLVVIGPPASWIGSTTETERQSPPPSPWSSTIDVEVKPGISASLVFDVSASSLHGFELRHRDEVTSPHVTFYSIDVVWPRQQGEPSALLTIATMAASPVQVRPEKSEIIELPD